MNRRKAIAVIVGSATVAATAPVLGDIVREQQIAGDIFQVPCGPDGNKHVRLWATREGVVVMRPGDYLLNNHSLLAYRFGLDREVQPPGMVTERARDLNGHPLVFCGWPVQMTVSGCAFIVVDDPWYSPDGGLRTMNIVWASDSSLVIPLGGRRGIVLRTGEWSVWDERKRESLHRRTMVTGGMA